MRFITERSADQDLVPEAFWSVDPDSRVPLEEAEAMLLRGVERLGDDRLGLKLGKTMRFGEGGVFDYAVNSAATLGASLEVAGRYSGLITDTLRIWQEPWRRQALIRILDDVWAPPSADFAMCAFYKLHLADVLPPGARLECWFPYATPPDMNDYLRNFPDTTFRFGAPFFGFALDSTALNAPLPASDPILHPVHCYRVNSILEERTRSRDTATRVRRLILQDLRDAREAHAERVAVALGMSQRTMRRRLEHEGTSYAEELDAARRELAVVHVSDTNVPLAEVAFLLGFSHAESFHRAFKRWTGETPLAYRTRTRASDRHGGAPGPARFD